MTSTGSLRAPRQRRPLGTAMAMLLASVLAASVAADTVDARCDIYPRGEDHASAVLPCTFSQRQGYIHIYRSDGVHHFLSPTGEAVGNFVDDDGHAVYRQSGLGPAGLIFRMKDISVYVYWDPAIGAEGDSGA